MGHMFYHCDMLEEIDLSTFDTSKVTNMDWMFAGCTSLKTIYCDEDWSKNESVESSAMFFSCIAIEGGAGGLDSVIQYLYGCSAEELIEVYSKQRMVTQAIAKEEGITVTDEEVNARLEEVGAMYGMDGENYLKVNEISREKFKELMISEKVQQFVYENTNTPTAE